VAGAGGSWPRRSTPGSASSARAADTWAPTRRPLSLA